MIRMACVAVAVSAVLAGSASAQSCTNCGGSKGLGFLKSCPGYKPYPFFDSKFIKPYYCSPTVNADACFGYYKTQWRSWHEACGEPEPLNPGPNQAQPAAPPAATNPMPPAVEPAPLPKKPDAAPMAPKAPLTPPADKPKEGGKSGLNGRSLPTLPTVAIPVVPTSRSK